MSSKTLKKGYMSIGKVVEILEKESPTISISKIRFLEDEGLLEPKRTKGGYRRFTDTDVERLRLILKLQKDKYLPLKVIKDEIRKVSKGRVKISELIGESAVQVEVSEPLADAGKRMTAEEASEASGLTAREIKELESFGLIRSEKGDKGTVFSPTNIKIMHLVKTLSKHGIQARHLKMYQSFAERESTLLGQIVAPVMKQKSEDSKEEALQTLNDITGLSGELRQALLDNNLKEVLE